MRQEFINRANRREASHASDPETEGEEDSIGEDPHIAIDGGCMQAETGPPENNVRDIEDPLPAVATPAEANNPEASNERETSDYEPSDGEIAIARVGLTEADTGRAAPPQTRKRRRDEAHDDGTQVRKWCKALMYSRTRFSRSNQMRTVLCLYVLCDDVGRILGVSIFIKSYFSNHY